LTSVYDSSGNRRFLKLWLGQLFSQAGTRMYQIAVMWWILSKHLENGGKFAGIFMLLVSLPSIFRKKKITQTIDRFSALKILITADLCAA